MVVTSEAAWSSNALNIFAFLKNDPLREKFQNCVAKVFIGTPINVLCSNFVKFGRQEIDVIGCCLREKNFAWPSRYCYSADRAQNLPGQAPKNVLRVLQTSSKSVHFRRSYSRTREHRQNVKWIRYSVSWIKSNIEQRDKVDAIMSQNLSRNYRQ